MDTNECGGGTVRLMISHDFLLLFAGPYYRATCDENGEKIIFLDVECSDSSCTSCEPDELESWNGGNGGTGWDMTLPGCQFPPDLTGSRVSFFSLNADPTSNPTVFPSGTPTTFYPTITSSPTAFELCDVKVWVYADTGDCITSGTTTARYTVIADGECHEYDTSGDGDEDLGFYVATCGPNPDGPNGFYLSRSGCTDSTCTRCTGTNNENNNYGYQGQTSDGKCTSFGFAEAWYLVGSCQRNGCSATHNFEPATLHVPMAGPEVAEYCTKDLTIEENLLGCQAACAPAACCQDNCLEDNLVACGTYASCLALSPTAPTDAPIAASDDSSTDSPCRIQINTSQCDELIRENMADIPADCVNLCVAFEDGVFKQCDEGNSLSGFSGTIVAGCEFKGGDEMDDEMDDDMGGDSVAHNVQPSHIFLYFVVGGLVATVF